VEQARNDLMAYPVFHAPKPGIQGLIEAHALMREGIADGWVTRAHVVVFDTVLEGTKVEGCEEWLKGKLTL
jgi:hypothetical protein